MRSKVASFLSALVLAASSAAWGQAILYKWIDAQGKTQYSDQPPKNFKGEVTRIESDTYPAAAPAAKAAAPVVAPAANAAAKAPAGDYLSRRRTLRDDLAAKREAAHVALEQAKKALDEGRDPQFDELQTVQSRSDNLGGRAGSGVARSNCREVTANGKTTTICPGVVPKEEYYDRIAQLEAAVKKAEEDLDAAETAYRRGVD
jgi:hypothetical protein